MVWQPTSHTRHAMCMTPAQVVIEELDPQPPEEVAKAAGQKRKADLAAMEPKSAKRPAAQVGIGVPGFVGLLFEQLPQPVVWLRPGAGLLTRA